MQRSGTKKHSRSESASTKRNSVFSLWSSSGASDSTAPTSLGSISPASKRFSASFLTSDDAQPRPSVSSLADGMTARGKSTSSVDISTKASKKPAKSERKKKSGTEPDATISLMQNLESFGLVNKEKTAPKLPTRNRKRLISSPMDFYHVRHSQQGQVPDRMSKDDFSAEFEAIKAISFPINPQPKETQSESRPSLDGYATDGPSPDSRRTKSPNSERKRAPPLRPRRSDERLDENGVIVREQRTVLRHSRSAEQLMIEAAASPVVRPNMLPPPPVPPVPPPRRSSSRHGMPPPSQSAFLNASLPPVSQVGSTSRYSGIVHANNTSPDRFSLSGSNHSQQQVAVPPLTPFADSSLMLQQYGRELKEIPEEPEQVDVPRKRTSEFFANEYIAEVLGWGDSQTLQRLSTIPSTPDLEDQLEQSVSAQKLAAGAPCRRDSTSSDTLGGAASRRQRKLPGSRRQSQASIPVLGAQEQRVRKRRSSLRSDVSEAQAVAAMIGELELDWEDDVDYCYEHHMEAHCDLDWNNVSKLALERRSEEEERKEVTSSRHDSTQSPVDQQVIPNENESQRDMSNEDQPVQKAKKNPYEFESATSSDDDEAETVARASVEPSKLLISRLHPVRSADTTATAYSSAPPTPELDDHKSTTSLTSPTDTEARTPCSANRTLFDFTVHPNTPMPSGLGVYETRPDEDEGTDPVLDEAFVIDNTGDGAFDSSDIQYFSHSERKIGSDATRPKTSPGHYAQGAFTFDDFAKSEAYRNGLMLPLKMGHKRKSPSAGQAGDLINFASQHTSVESTALLPGKGRRKAAESLKVDTIVAQLREQLESHITSPASPPPDVGSRAASDRFMKANTTIHGDSPSLFEFAAQEKHGATTSSSANEISPAVELRLSSVKEEPATPVSPSAAATELASPDHLAPPPTETIMSTSTARPLANRTRSSERRSVFIESLDEPSLNLNLGADIIAAGAVAGMSSRVDVSLVPAPLAVEPKDKETDRQKEREKEKDKAKAKRRTLSLASVKLHRFRAKGAAVLSRA